ncbi:MAG: hypothetical protein D6780_05420 [Candidatus Dadabacteria bacterium]|nr:MAG: hypothetical protein D6780_05420 [Candidatus Dadabacteria bacterium]
MDKKGTFSKNLFSVQLQLYTLMEDVGGELACEALDLLSLLSKAEREASLKAFLNVLRRIKDEKLRLFSESEKKAKEIEDALFDDIIREVQRSAFASKRKNCVSIEKRKPLNSRVVSLSEYRAQRKAN